MAKYTIETSGTIKNTLFSSLPDKVPVTVSGIVKGMEDRETPTGTAKRFKGDFAVAIGAKVARAKHIFFPAPIRDAVSSALVKLGKWDSAEFVLTATKTQDAEGKNATWTVTFTTPPRIEQPRVIALLPQ